LTLVNRRAGALLNLNGESEVKLSAESRTRLASTEGPMPKHIARLIVLLAAFAAAALYAKSYFTADSFYRYGHYRADSVAEIAAREPAIQTPRACASCHALRHAEWSANVHSTVICEVCHGAAEGHPGHAKMIVPADTARLCTQCHEAMPGRPLTSIRQITVGRHPPGPDCIACHNPHAPRIGAMREAAADPHAGRNSAGTCAACHGPNGISANPDWPNLAGQSASYLTRALASFKVGARKNDTMNPMAQPLQDADVRNLASYFSGLSCKAPASRAPAVPPAILDIAQGCAGCHGEAGRGSSNPSLPRLAGQNAGYLIASLKAFKTGARDNPTMSAIAGKLADADVAGVAAYYSAQSCGPNSH
jgi:cytochrome c553